ncbi:MAG: hypothetical protein JWM80_5332 [Cyanobacteria bacterium RYN_339]|nr:hypothetical protein [Cyanobacteria bacterium RYN_339]
MRRLLATLLVLAPAAPAQAASTFDQSVDVSSAIVAVTVYPDRAQVTRKAHLDVGPGSYSVKFNHLPMSLMADSVRVGGSGSATALLHGFDLKTTYLGQSPDKAVAALETKVQSIEDADRNLVDQRTNHERQLGILVQTAKRTGDSLANQLAAGHAKIVEWQALLTFLQTQEAKEATAIRNLDVQRRNLAKQRAKLDVELNKLRGFRQTAARQIPVTVEVTKGGGLDLTLEYVVPGASWTPAYDARLDSNGERLDWRYYGVVAQQTGEDWPGVHLQLSTARPSSGTQPPPLNNWFLSLYQPRPAMAPAPARAAQNIQMQRNAFGAAADARKPMEDEDRPAQEPVAVVTDQGSSVTLDVPRAVNIPSDGEAHQTPVGKASFTPKLSYRVVPRVSTDAFLTVETSHAGPWPILPGPVKAFVGQDYVGTTTLTNDIVPGQRFTLAMGVDRGIQVRRQRLEKNVGEAGLLRKDGFAEYKYEVLLSNYKKAPQTVQVWEPVPQTTEQLIRVALDHGDAPLMANTVPGQARWEFTLNPGEKKQLHWGYKVEFPQGQMPSGLE